MEKIPITVGIIGHIDAIITSQHKQLVTGLFNDINSLYPASPVCLFSQLAPGADTEIANLFYDIKNQTGRDYFLIAPIPFEIENYQSAFNEPDKKKFQELITKSKRYFVLKHEDNVSHTLTENDLYRLGGQFVADSSVILIAIWNNEENGKKGGTADIVNYKKEGLFKGEVQDRIYDQKVSIISLECNRTSKPQKKPIVLPDKPLYSLIEQDAGITKCLKKIEQLNKAAEDIDEKLLQTAMNNLYSDVSILSASNAILRNYYAVADVLAVKNQKRYNTTIKFLFLLGFVFIVLFELYRHGTNLQITLPYTLAAGAVAFILYLFSKKRWQNHFKFLEDRIIAEVLRIQFFWNVSNVRRFVTNYVLRIYKSEFIWFKHLLQAINGITYHDEAGKVNTEILKNCWLTSELNYFEKKISLIKKTKGTLGNISTISFGIAILFMVVLLLIDYVNRLIPILTANVVTVIIGIALGIFALSSAYIEIKGLRQTINQYSLMKNVYNSTIDKLNEIEQENIDDATKNRQISRLFYLAGKEALVENGNWYLIFKNKEPKVQGIG